MTDSQPLIFTVVLGTLRPAGPAAAEALRQLGNGNRVRIEIKKATANHGRLAFYWLMLKVAAENLDERVPGLTPDDLHDIVKQKLGLGHWLTLPSGDRVFRPQSISFAKMAESDRAAFINRVDALLANWLGCQPGQVIDEARQREAA